MVMAQLKNNGVAPNNMSHQQKDVSEEKLLGNTPNTLIHDGRYSKGPDRYTASPGLVTHTPP